MRQRTCSFFPGIVTASQRGCGKGMFSIVYVCQSFCPQGGSFLLDMGPHWTSGGLDWRPIQTCSLEDPHGAAIWWPLKDPLLVNLAVRMLLEYFLVTSRNKVVAKVIFLHLSVILFTGGVCQGKPPLPGRIPPPHQGEPPPARENPTARENPPDQTPPARENPPQTRPPPPLGTRPSPPGTRPPPRKQTPAYDQRAAGTHPTGMHSC